MQNTFFGGTIIGIVGLLICFALPIDVEEWLGLPLLFHLRGETVVPPDATVVDLDDLADMDSAPRTMTIRGFECTLVPDGRVRTFAGPLPRCAYAILIERLSAANPRAIVLDISFERLGDPEEDRLLADVIADAGNVILLRRMQSRLDRSSDLVFEQLRPLHPEIGAAAFAWGPFPLPKRPSRVNQFWTYIVPVGDLPTLPTLALFAPLKEHLATLEHASPVEEIIGDYLAHASPPSASAQLSGHGALPAETVALMKRQNSHYLNFYGPPGSVNVVDGAQFLGAQPPLDLSDKTVFLGQVHLDTYQQSDSFLTVYSQANGIDLAGVEIAATAYLNLLHNETLKPIGALITLLIIVLAGFVFAAIAAGLHRMLSIPLLGLTLLVYTAGALFLFAEEQIWAPTFTLYAMALVAIPVGTAAQADRLKKWTDRWVPKTMQPDVLTTTDTEAKPREVVGICLRSDVEDYSGAANQVTGLALHRGIDVYLSAAADMISESGGAIYIKGDDSFLAEWPLRLDEPERWPEVLDCIIQLSNLALLVEEGGHEAVRRNRIGFAHGAFSVGGMGTEGHYTLNLQGHIVNLAARLETLNKDLGTRILAPASLAGYLGNIPFKEMGAHELRGQIGPVAVIALRP